MSAHTFMDEWRSGQITDPGRIHDHIEQWHKAPGPGGPELHEHLGMTWEQYKTWLAGGDKVLPPGDIPVWLLDVDGVINADVPGWDVPATVQRAHVSCRQRSFALRFAPPLIERIRGLHDAGLVEIRWATTWCCEVPELEKALGVPHFESSWTDHISGHTAALAKLAAAVLNLREGRRLIWTDDTETPENGDIYDRLTFDGRALLIRPSMTKGLQPQHLDTIEAFCRKEMT